MRPRHRADGLAGFSRLWKPWGLVIVFLALFATAWPGWATSAATVATFAFGGGNVIAIAVAALLAIGITLTSSQVVYQTVERLRFLKVGILLLFVVIALFAAVAPPPSATPARSSPPSGRSRVVGLAILVGALAAAGRGRRRRQSNWITTRAWDGQVRPAIVSPITGEEEAALSGQNYEFPRDEENLSRWRVWWKRANLEQLVSFALIAIVCIGVFSLVAYSTVFQNPDLPSSSDVSFISLEADVLDEQVGSWFGTLFLVVGAVSLFAAALGIVDYVSRLVADAVRCGYTEGSKRWTESRLYFMAVWTLVLVGTGILLLGFDQPLVLLTISTVLGGFIMFVYSCLLVRTNRKYVQDPIKLSGYRLAIMGVSILILGATSVIVGVDQIGQLL